MTRKDKVHFNAAGRRRILRVRGRDVPFWNPPVNVDPYSGVASAFGGADVTVDSSGDPPGITILTTDNPQTVINANTADGQIFIFEAGTHNISSQLTPSNHNQQFIGLFGGSPVSVSPTGIGGGGLGKTKQLWSGTHQTIIDGGGSLLKFMKDDVAPNDYSGIRIAKLKFQNFATPSSTPFGVVGGRYTQNWIIEDNWFAGGHGVHIGPSMVMRRNRLSDQRVQWCGAYDVQGTAGSPIIIEDNDVYNVNVTEEGGVVNDHGDPQWHGGMKLLLCDFAIVRRNYIRECHGPGIWFDGHNDNNQIYNNILYRCGLHDDGGTTPGIFYEISPAHNGALIHNNWVLGRAALITISVSHGDGTNYIEVYENTIDGDDGARIGTVIKDNTSRAGGDSTASHPAIDTVSIPTGRHFADRIRFQNNVVRKRTGTSHEAAVPVAGMQLGGGDPARNFEFLGNKYEIQSGIASPFTWSGTARTWGQWQNLRAAANDVQNTGPLFDTTGDFVTWSGSKQFADTTCNWENA